MDDFDENDFEIEEALTVQELIDELAFVITVRYIIYTGRK